jgi:hypothetical protein
VLFTPEASLQCYGRARLEFSYQVFGDFSYGMFVVKFGFPS